MLTGKQKSELRGIAQTKRPLFQMGKDAVSENLIKTISDSLEAHELVKVSLLKTCGISANEAAVTISAATHSEVVQVIGRTFTLYRRSKKISWGCRVCELLYWAEPLIRYITDICRLPSRQ
ncbi:RNA-binding protein, YhbY family [Erysipelotrichaceae bacterium 3_1_53]|nr:RNA-binding protein, YhbY family [Erysipelotrichaceae bacterium 3_1_53]